MTLPISSAIRPFCIAAYILKKEKEQTQYLLLRRSGKKLHGNWQMVSGGIEKGETAPQAAIREIQEETGLTPHRLYSADTLEIFYEVSKNGIIFVPVFVAFIDIDQTIRLSPSEHDAYQWLPFEKALTFLEFSNQKRIISHIDKEFVQKDPNSKFLINFEL